MPELEQAEEVKFDKAGEVLFSTSEMKRLGRTDKEIEDYMKRAVGSEEVSPNAKVPDKELNKEENTADAGTEETKEQKDTKKKAEEAAKSAEPAKKTAEELLREKLNKDENERKAKAESEELAKLKAEKEAKLTPEEKLKRADELTVAQKRIQELEEKEASRNEEGIFNELLGDMPAEESALVREELDNIMKGDTYTKFIIAGLTPNERASKAVAEAKGLAAEKIFKIREDKLKATVNAKETIEALSNTTKGGKGAPPKSRKDTLLEKALTEPLNNDETEELIKLGGL